MTEAGLLLTSQSIAKQVQPTSISTDQAGPTATQSEPKVDLAKVEKIKQQLQIIFDQMPDTDSLVSSQLPQITTQYLLQIKSSSQLDENTFNHYLYQEFAREMQQRGYAVPAVNSNLSPINQLREAFIAQQVTASQPTSENQAPSSSRSRRAIDADSTILYTLVASQIDRLEVYDTELDTMIQDMETLTAFLNESRTILSVMYDGAPTSSGTATMPAAAISFMNAHGLGAPTSSAQLTATQYQNYITGVESLVEQNNNESQLQIFQLQQVVGYRNQVYELITNTFARIIRVYETIIGNMRT